MNYKIFLISRRGQGAGVSPRSPEGGQFGKVIVNQLKGYPKSFCVQAFVAHTQLLLACLHNTSTLLTCLLAN